MQMTINKNKRNVRPAGSPFTVADHNRLLVMYMFIVLFHFAEHIIQAYQVFGLGWARADAGGLLGEQFPGLATNEVLHFAYNLLLLVGLLILYRGFSGKARIFWAIASILQGWHFLEHFLLQAQWASGFYLFNAPRQTSILENFVPRIELHFVYNTLVTVPIVIAVFLHIQSRLKARQSGTMAMAN